MSRKHHRYEQLSYDKFGFDGKKPSLPIIIILILILLQFGDGGFTGHKLDGFNGIDNGILFIIAIFYLSCIDKCNSGC